MRLKTKWLLQFGLYVLWISFVFPSTCYAVPTLKSPPEITTDISPTTGVIGQRFQANLRITAENIQAVEVLSLAELSTTWTQVGELSIEDTQKGNKEIRSISGVFVPFEIGQFEAPSFSVSWQNNNGTSETRIVKLPVVTISSVLDRSTTQSQQLKNIKPPLPLQFPKYMVISFWIFVGVFLIGLAVFLFQRFWKKHKFLYQPKSPYLEALQQIEAIQKENLIEHKKYKEFYTRLSTVMRAYINQAYHIDTQEMTSDEILQNLLSKRDEETVQYKDKIDKAIEHLSKFLHDSDMVKFAKAVPDNAMSNAAIKMASEIINLTSYKFDDNKNPNESDQANG